MHNVADAMSHLKNDGLDTALVDDNILCYTIPLAQEREGEQLVGKFLEEEDDANGTPAKDAEQIGEVMTMDEEEYAPITKE